MDRDEVYAWLKRHAKLLVSFDLDRNKRIDEEEFDAAVETVLAWKKLVAEGEGGWKVYQAGITEEGLAWEDVVDRCIAAPMAFVGRDESPHWLPFALPYRMLRPDLPEVYEARIAVGLSTAPPPPGAVSEALGIVRSDCFFKSRALSDVFEGFSDPTPEQLSAWEHELSLAEHMAEQKLRLAAERLGASQVLAVSRSAQPMSRGLFLSLLGTAYK